MTGLRATRMPRIVRDPLKHVTGMHAIERADRVGSGGIFVSSSAFERDNIAFKLKDVEVDPSQRRPRRAVQLP
jgi:hypothetical protein